MNNSSIADVFEQIADLLEFTGANAFRTRAYRNGARVIRELDEPVATIVHDPERKLTDIEGIGKDLGQKCETLVETGRLKQLDELLEKVPESVLALSRIPGLGPKKAAVLFGELGIATLEQLKEACEAQQVRGLKGFGPKTEQSILKGISLAETSGQRIYWAQADEIVAELLAHMRQCSAIAKMEMAGSYRRGKETVGDLDLLAVADPGSDAMDHFGRFGRVQDVLLRGETKMSIRTDTGLQIDLRVVPSASFGAALQYFTGSKEHNVVVRGMAKQQGLRVNEYGVYPADDASEAVAGESEAEVYQALGLPWFPPELREHRSEFEWAAQGNLPQLIELSDIRGDLHMHTTATDGKASLTEMAEAAVERGLEYIAITDHSQRVAMAQGLDSERLLAQWKEIDKLNLKLNGQIRLLKGIECDILESGGMDLPDEVLEQADWVIASLHYGQRQPRQQITDRIVGAIANPHVSIVAHPTGRLINRREPYDVDLDAVFQAASEHGTFLELNANPARLDLHDAHCASAKNHGIPIAISSDAHSVQGLDVLRFGILQARRAGLTKHDVVNTRALDDLLNS